MNKLLIKLSENKIIAELVLQLYPNLEHNINDAYLAIDEIFYDYNKREMFLCYRLSSMGSNNSDNGEVSIKYSLSSGKVSLSIHAVHDFDNIDIQLFQRLMKMIDKSQLVPLGMKRIINNE